MRELILAGLVEHWGYLDLSKNQDLNNIAYSYAKSTFLVARRSGEIIGTGALINRGSETGEIVRMSVAKSYRRQGIGRLILSHLIEVGKKRKFHRLVLETTDSWAEVIAFYQNCGFVITHYSNGDLYFELVL